MSTKKRSAKQHENDSPSKKLNTSQQTPQEYASADTGDRTRDNARRMIAGALGKQHFPKDSARQYVADKIETVLFQELGGTGEDYKAKCRTLLRELKNPQNAELNENISKGLLSPKRIAQCSNTELASSSWKQFIEQSKLELAEANRSDWLREQQEKEILEKLSICPVCQSKNTNLNKINLSCVCIDCNHEWSIKEEFEEIERERLNEHSDVESLSGGEDGGD
jgi:hypothetical protein